MREQIHSFRGNFSKPVLDLIHEVLLDKGLLVKKAIEWVMKDFFSISFNIGADALHLARSLFNKKGLT